MLCQCSLLSTAISFVYKDKWWFDEPNPKTRNFQISRPCEVRRSGQVTTFAVCAVFSLSFQAVVLIMETAINHRFF